MLASYAMTRTFAPSSEFYDPATAAGGAGGGSGQVPASGGAPASGQAPASGSGSGGGGGATPITLTPDSMVIPPGATAPIKYSDYVAQHVPRTQVEQQQAAFVQQFVKNLAAAAGKKPAQGQRQQQQPGQRTQPVDMFAGVRDLPLIDGRSLAELGERIQREGIGPLYEWAGQVNQLLEAVGKKLQLTEKMTGSLVEGRSRGEFDGKMKSAVTALAKEAFPGINIDEHPVLRDFAEDVYLSYDPNDPSLEREFAGILKSRVDGFMKLAAAVNQAKLKQAREQARGFLRPGGQGQPGAQGGGTRLSHAQIARNLFAADASAT